MSRIGRLPIPVPAGVDVTIEGPKVIVKGPKGSLEHVVVEPITVAKEGSELLVTRPNDERDSRSRHGLTRTLVNNMVVGVTQGYTKSMEIVGVGYRVAAKGSDLEFALGFSHPVPVQAPPGIGLDDRSARTLTCSTPPARARGWLARRAPSARVRTPCGTAARAQPGRGAPRCARRRSRRR